MRPTERFHQGLWGVQLPGAFRATKSQPIQIVTHRRWRRQTGASLGRTVAGCIGPVPGRGLAGCACGCVPAGRGAADLLLVCEVGHLCAIIRRANRQQTAAVASSALPPARSGGLGRQLRRKSLCALVSTSAP